jgi:hypothetical protein
MDDLVKNDVYCNECKGPLIFKTLKPVQQQQQEQNETKPKPTADFSYCLKCNNSQNLNNNSNKKRFVLIETNNDEECNLAINAIHSINPDAYVNVFENTSPNSSSSSSSKSGKNFRLLNSSSHSSGGSSTSSMDKSTGASSLSLHNDGSIERQESRDSGFSSLSNSSFESMKSLSLNDTIVSSSSSGTQLTIPGFVNDHNSESRSNRRKWKKEHAWRYSNSGNKSNIDDNEPINKPNSLNIIESIDEKYETSSDKGISKESSLDISFDNLNTNDTESTSPSIINNKNSGFVNQKKRGKLIREPTIDDGITIQISPPSQNYEENDDVDKKNNRQEPKKMHDRSSPPQKRATFIEKQMSIDESFPEVFSQKLLTDNQNENQNDLMNRMRAVYYNEKLNNKYEKQDSYRNITKNPFDQQQQRPKIPIVRVQSFIDFDESHEQQNESEQKNNETNLNQCSSPKDKKQGNINIIEHTNHSLDEALRTIKNHQQQQQQQQQIEKVKPNSFSTLYPTPTASTHLHTHHNLKLSQNHSLDLDHKPSLTNIFDPKMSLLSSSSSLINHTMPTPQIMFTQSASLDRYNYNPLEFSLVKSPYSITKKQNGSENNSMLLNNIKLYPSFDYQHRYSEPMIKIDQKESLGKQNSDSISTSTSSTIPASSSPSLSPTYNFQSQNENTKPATTTHLKHLYNPIDNNQNHFQCQQHPLYQLHTQQNSSSSPSFNCSKTIIKEPLQINKQESISPSLSPKPNLSGMSPSQSIQFKNEFLNAFLNPYLQSKNLQTHGYPFQSYIQNNDLIYNFSNNKNQFSMPSNSFNKSENDIFQQHQHSSKSDYHQMKYNQSDNEMFFNK